MLPLLYIVRMDVEADYLGEFVKWYDTRHGPDLIGTGFHSCNAYHSAVGEPLVCNVYEIPHLEIFSSEAYVNVRKNDHQLMDVVLKKISNHSNTVFVQEATVGIPATALRADTRPSRAGAVTAPAISTLRFNLGAAETGALRTWFTTVHAQSLQGRPGFMRSRLLRQAGKHPLFPSKQAEWQILSEWATLAEATAEGSPAAIMAGVQKALGPTVTDLQYNAATLSATLLNAHNWTT